MVDTTSTCWLFSSIWIERSYIRRASGAVSESITNATNCMRPRIPEWNMDYLNYKSNFPKSRHVLWYFSSAQSLTCTAQIARWIFALKAYAIPVRASARDLVALVRRARHEGAEQSGECAPVKRLRVAQWAARSCKHRVALAEEDRVVQRSHSAHPIDKLTDGGPLRRRTNVVLDLAKQLIK